MTQLAADGTDGVDLGDAAEVQQIANFAWQHLKAATTFRDRAIAIEGAASAQDIDSVFIDIRSYVSATILSTAASLEGLINELFIAPHCALRPLIPNFEEAFWGERGIERKKSILAKYQLALKLLKQAPLDEKAPYYTNVLTLIGFRNALVHYKPTWDNRQTRSDLIQDLNGRYPLSPFPNLQSDFLTMQSMSAGCANWAVRSFFEFVRAFDSRSNLDPDKMTGIWQLEV